MMGQRTTSQVRIPAAEASNGESHPDNGYILARPAPRFPMQVRPFCEADIREICSWVLTPHQLRMISGDVAGGLSGEILLRWARSSIDAATLCVDGQAVGFCTLSDREFSYPKGHLEVCHLVITPRYRRKYLGTTLLNNMRILAGIRGYSYLHGRVVRENAGSLAFAQYVHWSPTEFDFFDDEFRWLTYETRPFNGRH